jgi:hypothetical protein
MNGLEHNALASQHFGNVLIIDLEDDNAALGALDLFGSHGRSPRRPAYRITHNDIRQPIMSPAAPALTSDAIGEITSFLARPARI